ncbi:hypothetical protein [Geminicoccus flavidas]|nr:hypothetical protein [Geminicoccus flavidas]
MLKNRSALHPKAGQCHHLCLDQRLLPEQRRLDQGLALPVLDPPE